MKGSYVQDLTHWGRVTHICVGKLTIIGSDNGLSPGRRQAIVWTNAEIMLIEPLGTNFSEILIGTQIFWFTKMRLKMSSAEWRPFCLHALKPFPVTHDPSGAESSGYRFPGHYCHQSISSHGSTTYNMFVFRNNVTQIYILLFRHHRSAQKRSNKREFDE